MFTGLFENCRRTYHQRKQEHGEIITNDSCLYESISVLGGTVRNQNVIFLMQGFERSGMSLKPFRSFITSFPDGTARSVKCPSTNVPPSHGDKDTAKCTSSGHKCHNLIRKHVTTANPLHLMSKKCHYRHYNSDKFTLHKYWFTPFVALRITNNYSCQLLLN